MNFLAHLYLSGTDEHTVVGNFIGDYIKGSDYNNYPENIRKGILLHRQIDTFTDNHEKFREAKSKFRTEFGLYSGIIVDFLYDHYLAKNWNDYSDVTLRTFAKRSHAILLQNFRYLPFRVQGFLPFLIQNRRLESYATVTGIVQALTVMSNYTSLPSKHDFVFNTIIENDIFFEKNFKVFMHEIISFITEKHNLESNFPDNSPSISNFKETC